MIITNDKGVAEKAKHITTTAKVLHKWEFEHDKVAFNYRLPNLNAALGCAQMEKLPDILHNKKEIARRYSRFFENSERIEFISEPTNAQSNYWLNAILLKNRKERDLFLEQTNNSGVMTRPIWKLMNRLKMFQNCLSADLENSTWLEDRVVNMPSSVKGN